METLKEFIKILTPIIGILVAAFGIVQHFDKKNQEFKKKIWEERKLLYYEVTNYTSKISIATDLEEAKTEVDNFWAMYYGRLSIIEDASVYFAMIRYGNELTKVSSGSLSPEKSNLRNLSFKLAIECRVSLQNTWEPVKLEDLGKLDKTQKNDS